MMKKSPLMLADGGDVDEEGVSPLAAFGGMSTSQANVNLPPEIRQNMQQVGMDLLGKGLTNYRTPTTVANPIYDTAMKNLSDDNRWNKVAMLLAMTKGFASPTGPAGGFMESFGNAAGNAAPYAEKIGASNKEITMLKAKMAMDAQAKGQEQALKEARMGLDIVKTAGAEDRSRFEIDHLTKLLSRHPQGSPEYNAIASRIKKLNYIKPEAEAGAGGDDFGKSLSGKLLATLTQGDPNDPAWQHAYAVTYMQPKYVQTPNGTMEIPPPIPPQAFVAKAKSVGMYGGMDTPAPSTEPPPAPAPEGINAESPAAPQPSVQIGGQQVPISGAAPEIGSGLGGVFGAPKPPGPPPGPRIVPGLEKKEKPTAADDKTIRELREQIPAGQYALGKLNEALQLNEKAPEGVLAPIKEFWAGQAPKWAGGQPDVAAAATTMRNILGSAAYEALKKYFGPQMSNADIVAMNSLSGMKGTEPREVKASLLKLYRDQLADNIKNKTAVYQDFSSRFPGKAPPLPGGSPRITPGTVVDGYKFNGGDPADAGNWQKVQ